MRDNWGGKPLPFPVLLDDAWKTYRTYDVGLYPTIALLDPEGKVVPQGNIEKLEAVLKKLSQQGKKGAPEQAP